MARHFRSLDNQIANVARSQLDTLLARRMLTAITAVSPANGTRTIYGSIVREAVLIVIADRRRCVA